MDWTHVLAFLAPYLPTVGTFLKEMFQRWLDARYPKPDQPPMDAAMVQPSFVAKVTACAAMSAAAAAVIGIAS